MRHYTPDDEARLIAEVEAQGGYYRDETCMSDEIDELSIKGHKAAMTSGCEEEALFVVPYDPSVAVAVNEPVLENDPSPDAPDGRKRAKRDDGEILFNVVERPGEVTPDEHMPSVYTCGNDDLMRLWPRFRHVIKDRDPLTGGA
jgi:hypothetical protein